MHQPQCVDAEDDQAEKQTGNADIVDQVEKQTNQVEQQCVDVKEVGVEKQTDQAEQEKASQAQPQCVEDSDQAEKVDQAGRADQQCRDENAGQAEQEKASRAEPQYMEEWDKAVKVFFCYGVGIAHHYISLIKCILQSIKGYLD